MQKLVYENFSRYRETLVESLKCEDYEEQGLLELSQLQEAIVTVNEDLEQNTIDYMLYYVLMRSETPQRMQYKHLIELLDSLMVSKSQQAPQTFKNRPESSSIHKLKMRNQSKPDQEEEGVKDDEDNYSDEEIANDPDEDEDTNQFVGSDQN